MRRALVTVVVLCACTEPAPRELGAGTEKDRVDAGARVAWTGPGGLNVRAEPDVASTRLATLPAGTPITIRCQTIGTRVNANDVWDRLADREGYVADAYVDSGYPSFIPGVPRCEELDAGCGDIDWIGACEDEVLVWCDDDALRTADCGQSGRTCGWRDAEIGYDCLGVATDDFVLAGLTPSATEAQWIAYVGREVVPTLAGSRADRLHTATLVTWWALKEGVLGLANPLVYSNCNRPWGDEHIGPLMSCDANRAWQVGLAATQVPWPAIDLDAAVAELFTGQSVPDVLAVAARAAGLDPDVDPTGAAIVASTGALRRSWLLRHSTIGFTNQAFVVQEKCIDDDQCFGTGWSETARYAPNRATATAVMDDLHAIFDALAP